MIRFPSEHHPLPYFTPLQFWLLVLSISLITLSGIGGVMYFRQFRHTFYPGIEIDSVNVGGLSAAQAYNRLSQTQTPPDGLFEARVDDIVVASTSAELGIRKNIDQSIQIGISYAKKGPFYTRVYQILKLQFEPLRLTSSWQADQGAMTEFVTELKRRVDTPSEDPGATLRISGAPTSLVVTPGHRGREVELEPAVALLSPSTETLQMLWEVPVASTGGELSTEEMAAAKLRATNFVKHQLSFRVKETVVRLNDQAMVSMLAFPSGYNAAAITQQLAEWQKSVDRPPQDAEFAYDPTTLKVTTFMPHRDGLALDQEKMRQRIEHHLTQIDATPTDPTTTPQPIEEELPVAATPPAKTLAETNDIGINELIGLGESEYDHSIPNRIHNVALTTDRVNLLLIPPGAEFSFNKALGDVSAATGFKQAYVIKDGQTILGDGGGVCQVSSTLFRSVLNAGLKVTKRKAHSYRVSYYEQNSKPGIDATVYSGDVDLRFINDTKHHILIHGEANSETLEMKIELYGTSDGRTTEIVDHKTWDARPAPAPIYVVDPTLPPGAKKQIDFAASGIRASFTNVIKDEHGEILRQDTYASNYIPWSAKFLVGP